MKCVQRKKVIMEKKDGKVEITETFEECIGKKCNSFNIYKREDDPRTMACHSYRREDCYNVKVKL